MLSNTANNSASDKVNTRPRLKAYLNFTLWKEWIKNNQQRLALIIGYLLVAGLFYNLGQFAVRSSPPAVRIEEPPLDLTQIYNNLNQAIPQLTGQEGQVAGETELNCEGKIKGNISSKGKIYHLPGGAFYKRTNPEICFETEAAAVDAGFRKSKR